MRLSIDARLDYTLAAPADLLFALEVAQMHDQALVTDRLTVDGVEPLRPVPGDESLGRRTWAHGSGRVVAHYIATVDIMRPSVGVAGLASDRLRDLPPLVVPYLFPSRYCEADRFETAVRREFGDVEGGDRIQVMADWIRGHLDYVPGSSDVNTTAADTYVAHRGVCRDFAHLLIAMARAASIPARMVAAYAWQLDPPDFHAVVEVWLEGGWHLVDPTGLAPIDGIVRIGVGRDAHGHQLPDGLRAGATQQPDGQRNQGGRSRNRIGVRQRHGSGCLGSICASGRLPDIVPPVALCPTFAQRPGDVP